MSYYVQGIDTEGNAFFLSKEEQRLVWVSLKSKAMSFASEKEGRLLKDIISETKLTENVSEISIVKCM